MAAAIDHGKRGVRQHLHVPSYPSPDHKIVAPAIHYRRRSRDGSKAAVGSSAPLETVQKVPHGPHKSGELTRRPVLIDIARGGAIKTPVDHAEDGRDHPPV